VPVEAEPGWFVVRTVLEVLVALIILGSVGMIVGGRERGGFTLAWVGLLLSVTTVDLFVFYFEQFSTILLVVAQFALLLGVLRYRQRFLSGVDLSS
jgi:hypothetical protein